MAQTIKLKRSATQGASPTTSQLELGEVAINTYDGKMYIKKNVGGTESIVEVGAGGGSGGGLSSSFTLYEYTATANQTTFSGSDSNSNTLAYDTGTPPKILVYLNGVLLDHTTDYTATNGTSVVLTSGAAASDLVQVAAYKSESSVALDIDLADNVKLKLGDDDDLQIYHDGSTNNSVIKETGSGNLELWGNNVKIMNVAGTETQLNANPNGQVELYYDNSKKLETTSSGIQVQGAMASTTGTYSPIYYGGSSSLQLKSNSGELFGQFTNNGAAELYYDNTKKFETTSTGATITGNIAVTGTVDGRDLATDGSKLDNIESNADVTDTANVTAAGALMDSEVTNLAQVKAFDSSDYATAAQGTTADSAMQDLVDDTTPQLGGNLDLNSNNITGTGNISNTGTISSGAITSSSTIRANDWFRGASDTNALYSDNSNGTIIQTPSNTNDNAGMFRIRDGLGAVHFSLNTNTNAASFHDGTISSGAITTSGDITISKQTPLLTIETASNSTNPEIRLKSNGGFSGEGFGIHYDNSVGDAHFQTTYAHNNASLKFYTATGNSPGSSNLRFEIGGDGNFDFNGGNFSDVGTISSGNITTSGYLAGPATFTIDPAAVGDNTGTVVIAGNLQVDGTTTTINSTTLTVDDIRITLARNAANAAAANGGGIELDGANASILYDSTNDEWDFNKNINVTGAVVSSANGGITTASGTTARFSVSETGGATTAMDARGSTGNIGTRSNHTLGFLVNDVQKATLTAGGDFTVTNDLKLTTTNPRIDYDNNGSGALRFYSMSAAQERMRITSGGKIGAGVLNPQYLLHLNGGATRTDVQVTLNGYGVGASNGAQFGIQTQGVYIWNFENTDLYFATNNQRRLTINEDGNVGIGTASPQEKLHVYTTGDSRVEAESTTGFAAFKATNNSGSYGWYVDNSADKFHLFDFTDSANRITVDGSGNVGIGTSSPGQKLDVRDGTITSRDATNTNYAELDRFVGLTLKGNGAGTRTVQTPNSDALTFGTNNTERMRITSTGRVRINNNNSSWDSLGTLLVKQASNNVGIGIVDQNSTNTFQIRNNGTYSELYYNVNNPIVFSQSGGERMRIDSSGNVGIGTNGTVSATFQVEAAGIDTTTTSTTATTQVAIDTFAAATFRSARYTIQVTNSTDSTYHITEILLIHDGTTPQITEYGTIFTGSAEATFDADISSGNVRLLATPATTDSMTFKVVRHCITV